MHQQILEFWFEQLKPAMWWRKDEQLDQQIRQRFGALHRQAANAELWQWRTTAQGRLAEIILLDQFSRNMHRGLPESFAHDGMALVLAQEAIAAGADLALPVVQRSFMYMPFMHSESLAIHERAVVLFSTPGMEDNLDFELQHRDILQRFGRYPHRNKILGRTSTEQERVFLTQPGSSF
ncbi:Uncharacterized conserved protein, DUF924 family [Halopseudomonas litoralis]|uniref:Uncharacterized conserved protein, DUF924 family n=1 Tax=Halopseudomonas litoralis TaxID=797277 RepID=A0A1H1XNZ4_9GAMM|nr:DUF924 family protein [Halopseudomonas litoralis]SDT10913.1 Uncharacterized conserved protein, DUF924 family [Halopseudomonas litoralis]